MALPGVLARSLVADVLIILAEGFAVLSVQLWATPPHRGFSCADHSIRQPYRSDTISTLALGLGFIVGAIVLMVLLDLVFVTNAPSVVMWRKRAITIRVVLTYRAVVAFLCGIGFSQLVTDIAKYHVGALRPHFVAVCEPNVDCTPRANFDPFAYVENYECQGESASLIEEARVSFPSGHANISFYCATFLVAYFQSRMPTSEQPGGGSLACFLARPLLQGMALLAAWLTTVSRVMDNMHHFRDVTAGGLLGVVAALLIIVGIKPFREVAVLQPNDNSPLQQLHPSGVDQANSVALRMERMEDRAPVHPA